MEIYLVRHTGVAVPKSVCYGQSDVPLAQTFEVEAEQVISKVILSDQPVVYSSPATRCVHLARHFSADYLIDNRLQELNFGTWENTPWEAIPAGELDVWMNDFVGISPPEGENFLSLHQRTGTFWQQITQSVHSQLVIITHAGVIRSLLCRCLGIPLVNAFRIQIDYGSVTHIRLAGGIPTVLKMNI